MNNQTRKDLEDTIKIFKQRVIDLEISIKRESNQGVKKIMQQNYVLNSNLLKIYEGKIR